MKRKNHTKNFKAKVALAAIKGQKTTNEIASEFGVHISQVNRWKKEALEALPEVLAARKMQLSKGWNQRETTLFQQIGKLQVEVDWLKKTPASGMSITEKRSCIDPSHDSLSIGRQCALIELSHSSYYRQNFLSGESDQNLAPMRLIDEEYTKHPFYGTRKMRDYLRRQGYKINWKRVQRLMRKMGLQSIAPKLNTSKPHPEHTKYPYLLRNLKITCPDQVWCSDITHIPLPGGFVYLTAVMDWYSRFVLSWEVSVTMDSSFCVSALESVQGAMERKTPLRHLTTFQETGYGSWMDVGQSGGIRCGLLSRINQMQDFLLLVRVPRTFVRFYTVSELTAHKVLKLLNQQFSPNNLSTEFQYNFIDNISCNDRQIQSLAYRSAQMSAVPLLGSVCTKAPNAT